MRGGGMQSWAFSWLRSLPSILWYCLAALVPLDSGGLCLISNGSSDQRITPDFYWSSWWDDLILYIYLWHNLDVRPKISIPMKQGIYVPFSFFCLWSATQSYIKALALTVTLMYCAAVRAFKKLSEFTLSIKFPFVLPLFYISLEKSVKSIEKKKKSNWKWSIVKSQRKWRFVFILYVLLKLEIPKTFFYSLFLNINLAPSEIHKVSWK